jgi:hypothetical protein
MGGETPPPVERGCYLFLTLPPEELREPEDEPREEEPLLRETELRDPLLDRPEDEEPTLAELRPDDELPERTDDELPDVPRTEDGRE